MVNILHYIFIVCYGISFWFLTIYRIFEVTSINEYIIVGSMIAQFSDILVQEITSKELDDRETEKWKEKLSKHLVSILFLLYLCYIVIEI